MTSEEMFLRIVRGRLAATKTLHKVVAFKCGVSQSMFSQYINGDLSMPERIRKRLIIALDLKDLVERLSI